MAKDFPGEKWKEVRFDFEFTNDHKLFISNFGRLKTYNKLSDGNIINGSMINGYRIIRLKFFKQRHEKTQKQIIYLQKQIEKLSSNLKLKIQQPGSKKQADESSVLLTALKKNLQKKFKEDSKQRTINYHSLIHRLVAEYFLKAPNAGQTIVAHLDYDKLNNRFTNLKWMTPEENYKHQQNSPHVIKEKEERRLGKKQNSRAAKLTVTKVMLLKKLLNQNKPVKQLIKMFKISDMQIYRIKRGENWKHTPAAE